jgi:ABC-type antimicrobial peptide transport system permease subunit
MRVVGVVGDVRSDSPAEPAGPELYMPVTQHPYMANELQVVVRSTGDPALLSDAVRQTVRGVNPDIATSFTTLRATVDASIAAPRFRTFLTGVFATLALLLAMAGIHGVMSYAVARRRAEFGLRAALGASAADIVALVLGAALRWAVAGLAIGAVLSFVAVRLMTSLLVGVRPADGPAIALAIAAVALAMLTAVAVPLWRAARVDPLSALREE